MPSTPWEQFKFGLFFGMGLCVAFGVLYLIILILTHSLPAGFVR